MAKTLNLTSAWQGQSLTDQPSPQKTALPHNQQIPSADLMRNLPNCLQMSDGSVMASGASSVDPAGRGHPITLSDGSVVYSSYLAPESLQGHPLTGSGYDTSIMGSAPESFRQASVKSPSMPSEEFGPQGLEFKPWIDQARAFQCYGGSFLQ